MALFAKISSLLIVILLSVFYLLWKWQSSEPYQYQNTKITYNEQGIATLSDTHWENLFEAQGYLTASQRMWQMDLSRRAALGKLSEWFGEKAIETDEKKHKEFWPEVIAKAVANLPEQELKFCNLYAKGVNQFIDEYKNRWGLEYTFLQVEPEKWVCGDSLAVGMMLIEHLTSAAEEEELNTIWYRKLPEDWRRFLFPKDHPWNVPNFHRGEYHPKKIELPKRENYLTKTKNRREILYAENIDEPFAVGSNSWVFINKDKAFLANDPHLQYSVPSVWYFLQMKTNENEWVKGASVPGFPGIILGTNQDLAWSFTNLGEDVDDYLEEKINWDELKYFHVNEKGFPVWIPLDCKLYFIKVKNQNSREGKACRTHRGPVVQSKYLENTYYSRQWLPYRDQVLAFGFFNLMRAKNLAEAESAIHKIKSPAQNILVLDQNKNGFYMPSGVNILRQVTGREIQTALKGEWKIVDGTSQRPKIDFPTNHEQPFYFATANERQWEDPWGHRWFSDERKKRIIELLASQNDF